MPKATTRYVLPPSNLCVTYVSPIMEAYNNTPVLINGNDDYDGNPPLYEVDGWPMANLLSQDRYTTWKCPALTTPPVNVDNSANLYVEVDLGLARPVRYVGLSGFHKGEFEKYPASVQVYRCLGDGGDVTAYTNTLSQYVSFGPSISTSAQTADYIVDTGGQTTVRYLRFMFRMPYPYTSGFSVGRLFAAASVSDLGVVYSPGSVESVVAQQSRVRLLDGHEVVTTYGPNRKRWVMSFKTVNDATLNKLRVLATSVEPFYLWSSTDTAYEVRAVSGTFQMEAVWGVVGGVTADVWNCTLEVESLP